LPEKKKLQTPPNHLFLSGCAVIVIVFLSSVDTFQSILSVDIPTHREFERTTSIEILNVKSELIDNEEPQLTQSFISTNSLLVSPSLNTNRSLSTSEALPRRPKNNIWPSVLSINTSTRQAKNKTSLRKRSNGTKHSHLTSNIPKQVNYSKTSKLSVVFNSK
jgi:hypothetical protein